MIPRIAAILGLVFLAAPIYLAALASLTPESRLFEGPVLTVKYFFQAINADYTDELLVRGVDKRGEIKDHPDTLAEAEALGKKLVLPG